ncbi:MAG: SBBP repeat-containing protein [Methanobacterium sp.]
MTVVRGVAVDDDGNAYITGSTYSTNFPTTPDAYQTSHAGGCGCFCV